MDFKIVYFKNSIGDAPVEKFLLELKALNNPLAEQAFKGLEKLKNRAYHREPLSKYLEPGLWELRVKAESGILRIIYTFSKGQTIILLHAFVKKQQKTPKGELEFARRRLNEATEREKNEKTKRRS